MSRSLLTAALSLAIVALSSCTVPTQVSESQNVPPGKVYAGPILNIAAPNSEGWQLLKSDPSGMAFARRGSASGESFAAQVAIFDPPQTNSPEEFEALIVKGAQSDAETERFSTKSFIHQFTSSRGYPCVQMKNISEDRQAEIGPNKTETLVMQNEHLYCRHPAQKNIGFAITYSHRGKDLHPDFENEAQSFIEGVQVPKNPTSK
ncbi:MAG: hypothetical protein AB1513_01390 [Pseudomonadota bacterium]